ncbi:MAG: ParB N-terminal domain-containing protein [Planctomycetes bacterium]|nr:ParB N-terminal domain-containing protein [Planctomycetota bacterium]
MHTCSIHKELAIVPGDMSDYRLLAAYHYREGRPVGVKAVYTIRPKRVLGSLGRRPAGVIVYAMPNPRLELRTFATNGAFHGLDRQTELELLNRHLERTGRYEPLVVRPYPGRHGFFQILHGHHRCEALRALGRKTADAVVWNVSDIEADLLLATLNRLGGRDMLDKKVALLRRLSVTTAPRELARLLPQTRGQLERLINTEGPVRLPSQTTRVFAKPIVFFAEEAQEQLMAQALAQAAIGLPQGLTRAAQRTAALTRLARSFLGQGGPSPGTMSTLA